MRILEEGFFALERFNKYCSRSGGKRRAVFLASGFVFARLQPHWRGCSLAQPRQEAKNPRSEQLHYFLKRSRELL